jgi:hypothetical protein
MTTHRNHYVPKWYQRRFFKKPDVGLYYIDSTTSQGVAAQAAQVREHKRHSPKFCFWGEDLYTTILLGTPNDDTQDVAPRPIVPTAIGFAPSPTECPSPRQLRS